MVVDLASAPKGAGDATGDRLERIDEGRGRDGPAMFLGLRFHTSNYDPLLPTAQLANAAEARLKRRECFSVHEFHDSRIPALHGQIHNETLIIHVMLCTRRCRDVSA